VRRWFHRSAVPVETAETVAQRIAPQGLFIIGHARSGTTVLQNALNASPDIFLLGEPDLHTESGAPGFAARYGAMHRAWGNQKTKSTDLPPVLPDDPPWWQWLDRLAQLHRRVGAKIALNPLEDPEHAKLLQFQAGLFYRSTYLFCFRDPVATAVSTWRMAELTGDKLPPWDILARSIRSVMRLYVTMLRLFPNVHAVFNEAVNETEFERLGGVLGCDLGTAATYYDTANVRRYTLDDVPPEFRTLFDELTRVDALLRDCVAEGPALVQLEQNINNFSPSHRSSLERLSIVLDGLPPGFAA
jgi:hypothetical protein